MRHLVARWLLFSLVVAVAGAVTKIVDWAFSFVGIWALVTILLMLVVWLVLEEPAAPPPVALPRRIAEDEEEPIAVDPPKRYTFEVATGRDRPSYESDRHDRRSPRR